MKYFFGLNLIFYLIFFLSCNFKKENIENDCVFFKKEQIRFPADSTINPYAINIQFFKNNGVSLLFIMDGNNQLLKYDFKQQKLLSKIKLEKEGNNGVGAVSGFTVISLDSILITSIFEQRIFLVDSLGSVIDKYLFNSDSLYTSPTMSNLWHQVTLEGNELVIPQLFVGNLNHIVKEVYDIYTTTINLDIVTGKIQRTGMKSPFRYPNLKTPYFSSARFNENFVYSFFALDSIFVVDKNGKMFAFFAKSENVKELVETQPEGSKSIKNTIKNNVLSSNYYSLIADSINNVIYRFYKIGLDKLPKDKNLMDLRNYPPMFGVQVINNKFSVIADIIFPTQTYFFYNSFVAENGLYISINHPENPDFDVDYFTFDCFVFQK